MSTFICDQSQATIVARAKKTAPFDWRPPEMDDAKYFLENPDARFLLRPWRMNDDRHASGSPKLGTHHANLRDMEGITIVYRAGCRDARFYASRDHQAWRRARSDALYFLRFYPELGVGSDGFVSGGAS